MRFQTISKSLKTSPWRIAVFLAMVAIVVSFLVQLLLPGEAELRGIAGMAELVGLIMLFTDLTVNFSRAENKVRFLKKNWFELLLFVPFSFVFEAFRTYEILEVMGFKAIPFLVRTQVIVVGSHTMTQLGRSEPVRLAQRAVFEIVSVPDRYSAMKYRGMLNFSYM
jgi:predicted histidine transporter YuiF (NhaC family)